MNFYGYIRLWNYLIWRYYMVLSSQESGLWSSLALPITLSYSLKRGRFFHSMKTLEFLLKTLDDADKARFYTDS